MASDVNTLLTVVLETRIQSSLAALISLVVYKEKLVSRIIVSVQKYNHLQVYDDR